MQLWFLLRIVESVQQQQQLFDAVLSGACGAQAALAGLG